MGWLLGCFKCTGKPEAVKPKKHLSGSNSLVPGRSNSAAVAHATSPEGLHVVRKSPLAVANSKGDIEKEPNTTLSSPLQDQAKTKKSVKSVLKQDEDKVWSHEYDLDGELEIFRERLLQDANAAKQLSDEAFLRGCDSLESPSSIFKVTSDKADQDATQQVDYTQHSWLVSSLVIETCSRPSSPLLNLGEGGSQHSRGIYASHGNSFDSAFDNNALKCAELSLFRVESGVDDAFVDGICESLRTTQNKPRCGTNSSSPQLNVPSPPWTFSAAKSNEKLFSADEHSDDLLSEHLDVTSLIEDSALITNWELSSGSSVLDTLGLNDHFLAQIPNEGKPTLPAKLFSLEQANQKPSDNRIDGSSMALDLSGSATSFETCTENQPGFCKNPFLDKATCSSNGLPSALIVPHAGNVALHAEKVSIQKDAEYLHGSEFHAAHEEIDNGSTSHTKFRLSKRVWSSPKRNLADKSECTMGDHLQHNYARDAHEVLLPAGMRPEMEPLQESKSWEDEDCPLLSAASESSTIFSADRVRHWDRTDLSNGNTSYFSISSLEANILRDTTEDVLMKGEADLMMTVNPSLVSFPVEEEKREQRKKIRIGDDSVLGGMREGMQVQDDDKVPLLLASEDGHQSRLEAIVDCFSEQEGTASKQIMEGSSSKKTPLTSPSSPHVETPPSVTSYRSSASLGDERPILGTVAAHWSPIITRKWWDGKGIPNSTNKYQEDQKVSWHAIPFEVRLEQALAKQDTVLSK